MFTLIGMVEVKKKSYNKTKGIIRKMLKLRKMSFLLDHFIVKIYVRHVKRTTSSLVWQLSLTASHYKYPA